MGSKKYSTQSIVEIGIMSAIILILMLMNAYVPLFNFVGVFVLPLPITILYMKHDFKVALSAVIVSSILIAIFYNPIAAIGSFVLFGLTGLVIGYCIKRKKKPVITIVYQTVSILIGNILSTFLMIKVTLKTDLYSLIQKFVDSYKQSLDLSKKIYGSLGVNVESNPAYKVMSMLDVHMIMIILPGLLIISALFMAYINYILTRKVLKRLRYEAEPVRPFTHWYLDNRIGAGLIALVCLGFIFSSKSMAIGEYILTSSMTLLQFALSLDGLAVLSYVLKFKFNMKKGLIIFLCIMATLIPAINLILMYVGLTDIIMDIRKLDPNSLGNTLGKRFKK